MDLEHAQHRHIVVALDGGDESRSALDVAVRMARSTHARLDLLVVIPDTASTGVHADLEHVLQRAATRAADLRVMRYAIEGSGQRDSPARGSASVRPDRDGMPERDRAG
jgi:nucleotide-binding universal stress UspA family protein